MSRLDPSIIQQGQNMTIKDDKALCFPLVYCQIKLHNPKAPLLDQQEKATWFGLFQPKQPFVPIKSDLLLFVGGLILSL
jgi:hypothetical protein